MIDEMTESDPSVGGRWFQFAIEAVRAVLGYYLSIGIFEIWASTDPKNESSMKLLRTVGFQLSEAKRDDMVFRLNKV